MGLTVASMRVETMREGSSLAGFSSPVTWARRMEPVTSDTTAPAGPARAPAPNSAAPTFRRRASDSREAAADWAFCMARLSSSAVRIETFSTSSVRQAPAGMPAATASGSLGGAEAVAGETAGIGSWPS